MLRTTVFRLFPERHPPLQHLRLPRSGVFKNTLRGLSHGARLRPDSAAAGPAHKLKSGRTAPLRFAADRHHFVVPKKVHFNGHVRLESRQRHLEGQPVSFGAPSVPLFTLTLSRNCDHAATWNL